MHLALNLETGQLLIRHSLTTGAFCYQTSLLQSPIVICAGPVNKTALPSSKQ